MSLLIRSPESRDYLVEQGSVASVGRDRTADIQIRNDRVSRQHLKVHWDSGSWWLVDLDSSNGTWVEEQSVEKMAVKERLVVHLGSADGPPITFIPVGDEGAVSTEETDSTGAPDSTQFFHETGSTTLSMSIDRRISLPERVRIGRDARNEISFEGDLMVSRFHAEIVMLPNQTYRLIDLKSSNGTFLDGERVKAQILRDGQLISVGSHVFQYERGALEPLDRQGGFNFDAHAIDLTVGKKQLLNNVSFSLKPSSLTAVVGPSGSGKSTLLSVLSGQRSPTRGHVNFAGRDLHRSFDELRTRIGMVPQADLLHTNLRTKRALEYGAALRLPRDTTKDERARKVDEVMEDLGLSGRADLQISRLSGGQRKRASVALELITDPELLFLDEPTSGLDPGLDRQVMNMLKGLADRGHTVVIVTHSTANLDVCDDVIVMAAGGHLAYCGSPHGVLTALGGKDWADVFDNLEKGNFASATNPGLSASPSEDDRTPIALEAKRRQGLGFQFLQLCKRYVEVLSSDRAYLGLMILLPVLVGLVAQITGGEFGIGPGDDETFGLNIDARSSLLIIVLGAVFMGASSAIQEIVKERVIYERERATGLSRLAYVSSKLAVLAVVVVFQASVFVIVALAGRPLPEAGLLLDGPFVEVLLVVALLALCASILGLAISAVANSTDVAMPALVVVTMVQVVFSGAVPLVSDQILEIAGTLNPSYWAFNGLAAITDLNELMGYSDEAVVDEWEHVSSSVSDAISVMGIFGVAFFGVILLSLTLRDKRR